MMTGISPAHTKYLDATKGMRKDEQIAYLAKTFESNTNGLHVHFGSYCQFANNRKGEFIKEPIVWRVMNHQTFKKDNHLLLLSDYLLDSSIFSFNSNQYETSTLREDLNGYFHDHAFTKTEQSRIVPMTINGHDDVFHLAKEDYENPIYFADDTSRRAGCTDIVISRGGCQSKGTQAGT